MVTRQDLAAKKDHVSDRKKALHKVTVLVACHVRGAEI